MLHRAHPTRYAGAMFRSRLEARWAAFFDLAGWKWSYEPVDYSGWVPDFLLHPEIGDPIPVEVKPIEWPSNTDACSDIVRTREDLNKVRAYKASEVLVLGAYILDTPTCRVMTKYDEFGANPMLGVFSDEKEWGFDPALVYGASKGRVLDFAGMYGFYGYRIGGDYDGDCHLEPVRCSVVTRIWREAGNRVQWRAPVA